MREELVFDEEQHKYYLGDQELISVTRWIKSFFPEFNLAGASVGTAKVCTKEIKRWDKKDGLAENKFPKCVRLFGERWKEEVTTRKSRKTTKVTAKEVRALWEEKNLASRDEGTRIHQLIEQALNKELLLEEYLEEPEVVAATYYTGELQGLYGFNSTLIPEHRVYSKELGLAGTIDVFFETPQGNVILVDWKTNKELTWEGYNRGLTEATKHLTNSNLQIYTLQLSLYAYIIEKELGKKVNLLTIVHLRGNKRKDILIDYEKDLVEAMLKEEGRI